MRYSRISMVAKILAQRLCMCIVVMWLLLYSAAAEIRHTPLPELLLAVTDTVTYISDVFCTR